jgi:hypothetical protein
MEGEMLRPMIEVYNRALREAYLHSNDRLPKKIAIV